MFVRINGEIHYLWHAIDHEGEVLEAFVTKHRNPKAALRFLHKAMTRYGRPESTVTDKLGSYEAALRTIGNVARRRSEHEDAQLGLWRTADRIFSTLGASAGEPYLALVVLAGVLANRWSYASIAPQAAR